MRKTTTNHFGKSIVFLSNIKILTLIAAFCVAITTVNAQSSANYVFTTNNNGSLIDISTGDSTLVAASQDDAQSGIATIPFEFWFMGTRYTQLSVNSNGLLRLGGTAVGTTANVAIGGTASVPYISAFSFDQYTGASGKVHWKVTGTTPNRVLVIEWLNMAIGWNATTADGVYQVQLSETTGAITLMYGNMVYRYAPTSTVVSMGFSASNTNNNYATVNENTNAVTYTGGVTNYNLGTTVPTTMQVNSSTNTTRRFYTFTPPTPAAPTGLNFSAISTTGMTLTWGASSPITNVLKYAVYYSIDGGATYTYYNTTNVGTNTLAVTGLVPGTTYDWKVVAVSEGALSSALTGTQATSPPATYYWVGTATADFNTAATWNTLANGTGSTRSTALTTDILIVDGAGTIAGAAITGATITTASSIGQLKVTSNTAFTLSSNNTTTKAITITGAGGDDFVIDNGSSLILTNAANAVGIAFSGTGNTGDISGTLTLGGSINNTFNTTGGTSTLVTVKSTGIVNTTTGVTGIPITGSAATFSFANGSNCNVIGTSTTAYAIPLATWATTSNLTLSGGTSTTGPTNVAQSFGNFTYNNSTLTGTLSFFTTSTATIKGDLTIQAVGNGGIFRCLTSGSLTVNGNVILNITGTTGSVDFMNGAGTLSVLGSVNVNNASTLKFGNGGGTSSITGDVTVSNTAVVNFGNAASGHTATINGNLNLNSSGTSTVALTSGSATVVVLGNFNQTAGSFQIGSGTGVGTLRVAGSFTGISITNPSSATTGIIEFNGSTSQAVSPGSTFTGTTNVRVSNPAGIAITGTLPMNAGTTFTAAANGTAVISGTVTYSTTTTLAYVTALGTQTTGNEFPVTSGPVSLTINNTATTPQVSLSGSRTVTGTLNITAGRLLLGNNDLTLANGGTQTITTPGASKMIVIDGTGQYKRGIPATAGSYLFPIGEITGTTQYSPVTLQFTANSVIRIVGARVVDAISSNINTPSAPTDYLSRYWTFSENGAGGTYNYYINPALAITGAEDEIGTASNISAAYWDGSTWVQSAGTYSSGSLTSATAGVSQTAAPLGTVEWTGRVAKPIITLNSFYVTSTTTPGTTGQCTATGRDISVNVIPSGGTLSSVNISYNNGSAVGPVSMTNTTGSTYIYTIPAASPTNTTVTWSITATNSLGLSSTYTGATYQDNPNAGVTATATARPTTVCSGAADTLSVVVAKSGTVTLGAGGSSATTAPYNPFNGGYGGMKGQYLIRASELTAQGLTAGNITGLTLYVSAIGTTYNGFVIQIGNTALTALTSSTIQGSLSTVKNSFNFAPAAGANAITFDTPFSWDGTSNIIVSTSWSNNNTSNTSATIFYDATAFQSAVSYRKDNETAANMLAFTGATGAGTFTYDNSSNRPRLSFTGNTAPSVTAYSWSDGASTVGTTNPSYVTPTNTPTTSYTCTATVNSCPVVSNTLNVTVNPLPTPPTTTNSSQCGTKIPTCSVSDPNGYTTPTFKWYRASTGTSLIQSSTSTTLTSYTVSVDTTFYVSVINPTTGCESGRTAVSVTVTSPDSVRVDANGFTVSTVSCSGIAISLNTTKYGSTNTYTYTWSASPSSGSGISTAVTNTQNTTVTPTSAGTYRYTVLGDDGAGCSTTSFVDVVVNAAPSITSGPNSPSGICSPGSTSVSIVATGTGLTYTWQSSSTSGGTYSTVAANDANSGVAYNISTPGTLGITGLTQTYYYKCIVSKSGCSDVTSGVSTVTVVNPSVTSTTPASTCGTSAAMTLGATGSAGTSIYWYSALTGGNVLATGTSYTTPVISTTTPYYVSAETASPGGIAQIGFNSTANGATGYPTAFGNRWFQDWHQMVFTATELNTAGLRAGNITQIAFNVNAIGSSATVNNYEIKLATTTNTTLSSFITTGLTTVYGPTNTNTTTGWNTITFATPYNWDGVSNLLVDIRALEQDLTNNAVCYYSNTTGNTLLYAYTTTNNTSFYTSNPTPTATTNRLNVRFTGNTLACASSPRTSVTATVNTPPTITPTGTATICPGSSTPLNVTSSNDPNYKYTWTPGTLNGASQSVSPSSTQTYTVNALDTTSGTYATCATSNTVTVTVLPSSFTATAAASSFCSSGSTTISLSPTTGLGTATIQWQVSNDGSTWRDSTGQTGTTLSTGTRTITTYYRAAIKIGASTCVNSSVATVTVNNPAITGTTPAGRCGTGTLTLGATGAAGSTISWYTTLNGTTPVYSSTTPSSYTTPSISTTTKYYVSSSYPTTENVGLSQTSTSCGTKTSSSLTDWPIRFNTTKTVTINSVYVTPYAAGTFTIALRRSLSSTDSITQSFTFVAGDVGIPKQLTLTGFTFPSGNWQLTNTVGGVYRIGTYTCGYPYTSSDGGFSIVGSAATSTSATATGTYNSFYNFNVTSSCQGTRDSVIASINTAPAIIPAGTVTLCSGSNTTLSVSSTNDPNYNYSWTPTGTLSPTTGTSVTATPSATTKYYVDAVDASGGTYNGCTARDSVTVTVLPSSITATALSTNLCGAGSSTTISIPSSGLGTATVQWQKDSSGVWVNVGTDSTTLVTPNLDTTTSFRALVKVGGSTCLTSNTVTINVNSVAITSTTPAARCTPGTLTLSATGTSGSTIKWYAAATGGAALATGTTGAGTGSYTTPSLSSSTNYYVEAVSAGTTTTTTNVGPTSPSVGTFGTSFTGTYQIFTATSAFTLNSVDVFATSSGTVIVELLNSSGTVLQTSATYTVTSGQANSTSTTVGTPITIPINFSIAAGTGYRLNLKSTSTASILRNDGGMASYYNISGDNPIFTDNWVASTDYWYDFYKWNVTVTAACASVRTKVTATVSTPTTNPSLTPVPTISICQDSIIMLTASGSTTTPSPLLSEGFETNPVTSFNLNTNGLYSDFYVEPYYVEGTQSISLVSDSYDGSGNIRITQAAPVNLTAYTGATLSFYHICASEPGYDYGYVQYSTDNGGSWTSFPTSAYTGSATLKNSVVSFDASSYSDWNTQFYDEYQDPGTAPATSLWKRESINLTPYLSSTQFKVRFRMTYDGYTDYYGWLLDSVAIIGTKTVKYAWTPKTGLYTNSAATVAYDSITTPDTDTLYAKPNDTITYTALAYTDIPSACYGSNTVTINVSKKPTAILDPVKLYICDGSAELKASSVTPASTTLNWINIAGSGSSSATGNPVTVTGLTAGTSIYQLTGTNGACVNRTIAKDTIVTPTTVPGSVSTTNSCNLCIYTDGSTKTYYNSTDGKIIGTIQDDAAVTPDELGSTEMCLDIAGSVPTVLDNFGLNQPYLQRRWTIKPTTNTNSIVTLYFTNAELTALQAAANSTRYQFSGYDLYVTKYSGGGNGSYTPPASTGGVSVPSVFGAYGTDHYVSFTINSFSTFYVHPALFPFAPLPVELISFNGWNSGNVNELQWKTASEKNTARFVVEKSLDGSNFNVIGEKPAAGNSNTVLTYNLTDNQPVIGNNYYRLKTIDIDGQFSYSNVINIPVNEAVVNSFTRVYPNPTKGNLNVEIQSSSASTTKLVVYDIVGKKMFEKETGLVKGLNTITFDFSEFAEGAYVLQFVDSTGKTHTTKFVKK